VQKNHTHRSREWAGKHRCIWGHTPGGQADSKREHGCRIEVAFDPLAESRGECDDAPCRGRGWLLACGSLVCHCKQGTIMLASCARRPKKDATIDFDPEHPSAMLLLSLSLCFRFSLQESHEQDIISPPTCTLTLFHVHPGSQPLARRRKKWRVRLPGSHVIAWSHGER
jgi:hypothetical protein